MAPGKISPSPPCKRESVSWTGLRNLWGTHRFLGGVAIADLVSIMSGGLHGLSASLFSIRKYRTLSSEPNAVILSLLSSPGCDEQVGSDIESKSDFQPYDGPRDPFQRAVEGADNTIQVFAGGLPHLSPEQ